MKTTDIEAICPYTGLRSFSEEESLYFKGRDSQVDQVIELLASNKFLMVTGASGEGKSSLVYGGLIPNARAGFFKAQYTNWVVADFRPEREPITNMAKALANKFDRQPSTVETELRRGFSSLVDLYTNSDYFTDEQDDQWKLFSEDERKTKRRKGANLLILVDQFEEFFTNPENFFNEALSQDSQIVVNLILETARIALKRNLPIYLVCTMRSDYIGQCAAFRGLPEYIGFSQFFVPRLKRRDLKQVIEEPAILSGNRISQRLIERLVFDLEEGIDQLPILQHALSQVWLAADYGREEMDLIHYAMVGGMSSKDLPEEEQQKFSEWYNTLPEYKREYFNTTGLNKVIEIHANSLYESAYEYHNLSSPAHPISKQQAKRIIALTFSCLTKIDNSRAVRNRMTLAEITGIINDPGLSSETVGKVINIYREEANAFIRPFKTEDPSTHLLSPDTVLDITHESLIRNWNKLDDWAKTEYEYYATFQDFSTQLNRWKQNNKSRNYLLPIGPLAYFENWYAECKPNVGWIKRYSEVKDDQLSAEQEAKVVLSDTHEFLRRSANKVAVSRAFMKYGTQRIATFLAVAIMLILSGFYWFDAEQKQNGRVIDNLREQAGALLLSPEVDNDTKANYLLTSERYERGYLFPYLEGLEYKNRMSLSITIYQKLIEFDNYFDHPIKDELITFILDKMHVDEFENDAEFALINRNKFIVLLVFDEFYNPSVTKKESITSLIKDNYLLINKFFDDSELYKPTVPIELNLAIQFWLAFGKPDKNEISSLINKISPLSGPEAQSVFSVYYPKGSFESNGRESNDFNGGHHTLASLYGASGQFDQIVWCFETIIETGQKNYLELARVFNNHLNVIGYLYQYEHRDIGRKLVKWVASHTEDNPPLTLFRNLVIRAGDHTGFYAYNIFKQTRSYKGYFNPNLSIADRKVFNALMDDYERAIAEVKDSNERNYLLAMNYKRKAIFISKYHYDRNIPVDQAELDALFEKSIASYYLISNKYLEGKVSVTIPYWGDGVRTRQWMRKELIIYPDYMDGWYSRPYHTDAFFNYLDKNNLFKELYTSSQDLELLHLWVSKAFEVNPRAELNYNNYLPMPDQCLEKIIKLVESHPQGANFDKNLPLLVLANRLFSEGDSDRGMTYYEGINQTNIQRSYDRYEYIEKTFFLNQMKDLSVNLALVGKFEEAIQMAENIKQDDMRVYSYIFMADKLYKRDTSAMAFVFLDSVISINRRIDFNTAQLDNRFELVHVLSGIGGKDMNAKADEIMRDFTLNAKIGGNILMIWGVAREGNYYRAVTAIPATFTEELDLLCRDNILWEECKKRQNEESALAWSAMDKFVVKNFEYVFYQRF